MKTAFSRSVPVGTIDKDMHYSLGRQRWSPLRLIGCLFYVVFAATAPALGQTNGSTDPRATIDLDPAHMAASDLPRLHSMMISWRGERVFERYYNGAEPTQLANIKSASKSVISALVGIAIDQGLLSGVEQPIGSFFPELLNGDHDPVKQTITIEDLLTMRSGLETTSNRNYGSWVLSSNWIRYALGQPQERLPGTRMIYSTGNTHLLSAILTKVTGSSTWQFAQDTLAGPLGFDLARWLRDPQGIYFGGNDMEMTPRQLMAFGDMFLNEGRAGDRQVVPREWVKASFVARTFSPRERGRFYGYGWWAREMAGYTVHYAWGYGGQFVFIVPGLDLVVVTTSSSNPGEGRQRHLRSIYALVENLIVKPLSYTTASPSSTSID